MKKNNLPKLKYVSWSEFHQLGFELADQLEDYPESFDFIVSIARGGHTISRILSDFLKLPIYSFSIQSYTAIETQGELEITEEMSIDLQGKSILLVDEVIDSGKTLVRALDYLNEFEPSKITSVAMHIKPKTIAKPDFYVEETSDWIIYPYEIRESIESLMPVWEAAGKTKQDLLEELTNIGKIEKKFVERYLG